MDSRRPSGSPRRAVVFAAGRGERMGPLTHRRAKPALPFCRVPLLTRILRWLAAGGVEEVAVNLHHLPQTLEPLLREAENGRSSNGGPRPLRIHRSPESELLGTSGGLSCALDRLPDFASGDGPLLVLNGDTLPTFRLGEMVSFHRQGGGDATLLADADPGPEFSGERRLETDGNGVVTGLSAPGGPGVGFAGVWLLEAGALRHLAAGPGGLSRDLLPGLIAAGTGRAFPGRAPWFEIGTPRRYLEASLRARRIGIPAGEPGGPVRIGREACAVPAELVSAGCVIGRGSRVERSVLLEGVSIGEEAVVLDSVVAPGEAVPCGAVIADALFAEGTAVPLARRFGPS